MANEHSSQKEEEDVVEMKKALATGSASSQSNVTSSGTYCHFVQLVQSSLKLPLRHVVAPIVCYCMASILMTVVNKVSMSCAEHV